MVVSYEEMVSYLKDNIDNKFPELNFRLTPMNLRGIFEEGDLFHITDPETGRYITVPCDPEIVTEEFASGFAQQCRLLKDKPRQYLDYKGYEVRLSVNTTTPTIK